MSGLTIQEWLDAHKRVVGTRRVAGNSLVVQAASITTVDQPVSFAETANFALIRCCAPLLKAREGCHLSDLLFSILQTNPHLDGFLFDLSLADTNDLSKVLGERVAKGAGTRVANFVNPMYPDDEPEQPVKRVGCTFSSQKVRAYEKPVVHNERVFEVRDCNRVLPVYSLQNSSGLQWSEPLWGMTTPHLFTSTNCVSWPVHTQDPLIGPGDEPIEVSPFKGFNVDLKQLPELQHVKLEGCVGPRLAALQNEVARLDITRAETIFNAQFPSATRYDDTHERFMFYGRHNSIPQDDWEEGWEDLPELEVVTMEIYNSMLQAMTLPLQILGVGYIGAVAGDQHRHRDLPKNLVPNGDRVFGVFIPLTYPLNNKWIPGSSGGFPMPWEEQVMEAGLGDAFILDALLVHRGGGRPQDIPAMDPVSQVPNVRWVAFMHVATCQLPKNVTDGIRPPFWASNPKFGQGDKVETCTTKGCRKRATEVCYSCKEVRLCPSHKMSLCSTCDIPSSSVSSAPVVEPVQASAAAAPIADSVALDFPVQCFFPVGTTTLSLAWSSKKPCLRKDVGSTECPGVEALHGDYELPAPDPTTTALIRCDAGSILALRHGRWGGFGVRAEEKEKVQVYGWYLVAPDAHMVDMQMLLRAGAATPAINRKTGATVAGQYWCTCHQVCICT